MTSETSKNNIQLYTYHLQTKYPLPVLGNKSLERKGFLLIQETPNGYRIGEAAPLPSFHKTTYKKIQEELLCFINTQHLPTERHSLSQFAIDMLFLDSKEISHQRAINALYHKEMLDGDLQRYRAIKLKVGRDGMQHDLYKIQDILYKNPNIQIRLDSNCLWSYRDTLLFWDMLHQKSLAKYIEYIEDPIKEYTHLSLLSGIPCALDTVFSISHQETLLPYQPVAIILKPTLQGGWFEVQKCQKNIQAKHPNIKIIISSTFESSIGIAALMKLSDPKEIHGLGTLQYFCPPKHDLVQQPIQQINDQLQFYDGIYVDEDIRWDLLELVQ
jgi:O-succinylbenzoate synthase